jgi:hypothetical protein
MADAAYFREKADGCRELLKLAAAPTLIEQLQRWAREFEDQAAQIEHHRRMSKMTADLP